MLKWLMALSMSLIWPVLSTASVPGDNGLPTSWSMPARLSTATRAQSIIFGMNSCRPRAVYIAALILMAAAEAPLV